MQQIPGSRRLKRVGCQGAFDLHYSAAFRHLRVQLYAGEGGAEGDEVKPPGKKGSRAARKGAAGEACGSEKAVPDSRTGGGPPERRQQMLWTGSPRRWAA